MCGVELLQNTMPREYKRKTARGTSHDVLQRAALAVAEGRSIRGIAADFNICRMTLKRFIIRQKDKENAPTGYQNVAATKQVIPQEMEEDLAKHIKSLADMFHGLSKDRCRILAFEFAVRNKLDMPGNWSRDQKAGHDWWLGFKKRHGLAIRSPEATSFGRATAFNKPVVNHFFENLSEVMDRHKFSPSNIYNVDETGCTTVQKPQNVVSSRGKKQVGALTSGERGELVTVVYAVSAAGNVVPPLFIFPRVNYREHFVHGGPPDCIGRATRSGWINEEVFAEFLEHLVQHTRCSVDHKILLILDNHDTHISLRAIDVARENGIVLLTLPPHTSHKLQPLDVGVYGPFKTAYNRAIDGWLRSNPGKTVTIYDIPFLVYQAQIAAVVPRNIASGFKATGITPFDSHIFTEMEFAPAIPTDQEIMNNPPAGTSEEPQHEAGTSDVGTELAANRNEENEDYSLAYIPPSAVLPIPKSNAERKKTKGRKKGRTRILTDTPVRQEISEAEKSKRKPTKEANNQKSSGTITARKTLFKQGASAGNTSSESSNSDSDSDVVYDDESDHEDENSLDEIVEGDFVVVKYEGKSRMVHYIARVDVIDGNEFEGIFLKKVASKMSSRDWVFIPNSNDEASFPKEDVVCKLPQPKPVGGSTRRSSQLVFQCDLSGWQLKQ